MSPNGGDEQRPRRKTSGWNSRLKDVCRGKGPNIFVTSQHSRGPYRIEWSRWSSQQLQNGGCYSGSVLDNLGYPCENHHQLDAPFWARRSPEQGYDFKARR